MICTTSKIVIMLLIILLLGCLLLLPWSCRHTNTQVEKTKPVESFEFNLAPKTGIITSDFFGVQAVGHTAEAIKGMDISFSLMKEMGIGYVQLSSAIWTNIEPNAPVDGVHTYFWDKEDIKYDIAKKYGFKIQVSIQCRSNWATTNKEKDADEPCCDFFPLKPGYEDDWQKFVKAYVERYYDYGLREIALGDEINAKGHFIAYGGNAKNYGIILANAYQGAKQANPNVTVAMGFASFGSFFDNNPDLDKIEQDRKSKPALNDTLSFFENLIMNYRNYYDIFPTQCNDSYTGISSMYYLIKKKMLINGYEKPVAAQNAMSTQNRSTQRRNKSLLPGYYPDNNPADGVEDILNILSNPNHPYYLESKSLFWADQARQTIKKLTVALATGMEKIFIAVSTDPFSCDLSMYTWDKDWHFTGLIDTKYYCDTGDAIRARKPAYYSVKLLTDNVTGANRNIETLDLASNVYAYKFMKSNEPVFIIWHENVFDTNEKGLIKRNQQKIIDLSSLVQTQNVRIIRIVTELDNEHEPIHPSDMIVHAGSVQINETPVFVIETY